MKTKHGVQGVLIPVAESKVREVIDRLNTLPERHGNYMIFKDTEGFYPSVYVSAMIFDSDWETFVGFGYTYYVRADHIEKEN